MTPTLKVGSKTQQAEILSIRRDGCEVKIGNTELVMSFREVEILFGV